MYGRQSEDRCPPPRDYICKYVPTVHCSDMKVTDNTQSMYITYLFHSTNFINLDRNILQIKYLQVIAVNKVSRLGSQYSVNYKNAVKKIKLLVVYGRHVESNYQSHVSRIAIQLLMYLVYHLLLATPLFAIPSLS